MGTHNICLYKEVDKKYTGYNLKTMELLDCALIGVCAVIRSNTVLKNEELQSKYMIIIVINRDTKKGIADIFVKKGPFLKLYTSYIRDFETMTATLDEAVKKHSAFQAALKEFEVIIWKLSSQKVPIDVHKMADSDHLGLCSPFIHSVVSSRSVSRQ